MYPSAINCAYAFSTVTTLTPRLDANVRLDGNLSPGFLTEEDKKAQEAGSFDLAYGSDEIEITTSCMVEWDMDGQGYSLFKFGEELSAEEMFAMAEEIIDAQ